MTDIGPADDDARDGLLGWCLVANVAQETAHGQRGLEKQRGTRHFAPGALVWIPLFRWDPGHERVEVVGRHRGSAHRYVNIISSVDDLENFRVKGVYTERLVRSLNGHLHDRDTPRMLQRPWPADLALIWAERWNNPHKRPRVDGRVHPGLSVPIPPPPELHIDGETVRLAHYSSRGAHYTRTPLPHGLPGA